jgi:hypothetical protein
MAHFPFAYSPTPSSSSLLCTSTQPSSTSTLMLCGCSCYLISRFSTLVINLQELFTNDVEDTRSGMFCILVLRRMQSIFLPRLSEGGEKFKTQLVMAHFPVVRTRRLLAPAPSYAPAPSSGCSTSTLMLCGCCYLISGFSTLVIKLQELFTNDVEDHTRSLFADSSVQTIL